MEHHKGLIGRSRLLQQNRHLADIAGLANVRFVPILLQKSVEACGEP
jgi:hypothetical protein